MEATDSMIGSRTKIEDIDSTWERFLCRTDFIYHVSFAIPFANYSMYKYSDSKKFYRFGPTFMRNVEHVK